MRPSGSPARPAREALYKALSEEGDPRLTTLLGVLKALGIRLSAAPADNDRAA
jgi:probable addiction module antidote protein